MAMASDVETNEDAQPHAVVREEMKTTGREQEQKRAESAKRERETEWVEEEEGVAGHDVNFLDALAELPLDGRSNHLGAHGGVRACSAAK